jgi:hypothetical protein
MVPKSLAAKSHPKRDEDQRRNRRRVLHEPDSHSVAIAAAGLK